MNRQAIAFLTMFSLVLMLAVYYITMPIQQGDETPVVSMTVVNFRRPPHIPDTSHK